MLWGFFDLIAIYCNLRKNWENHSFAEFLYTCWGTARNSMECRCVCLGVHVCVLLAHLLVRHVFPSIAGGIRLPCILSPGVSVLVSRQSCVDFFWWFFACLVCPCLNGLFGCWCPSVPLTLAFYLSFPLIYRHPWSPCFLSLDLSKTGWSTTA